MNLSCMCISAGLLLHICERREPAGRRCVLSATVKCFRFETVHSWYELPGAADLTKQERVRAKSNRCAQNRRDEMKNRCVAVRSDLG